MNNAELYKNTNLCNILKNINEILKNKDNENIAEPISLHFLITYNL